MVIPASYSSHATPGDHVKRVIDATSPDIPISIYTYTPPNLSATRPFYGKLTCVRDIVLPSCKAMAKQFNIPLDADGNLDATVDGAAERIVKVLCNKGMVDPFKKAPVEVSGAKPW